MGVRDADAVFLGDHPVDVWSVQVNSCDRCGAAAKAQIITPSGDLLMCDHHLRKHADALALYAVVPTTARRPAGVA